MFLQLRPNPAYVFWAFWPKRGLHPRLPVGTHLKQPSSKMILCGFIKVVATIRKSTKSAYVYFKEQIKNLKKSAWALGHPPSFHYFWKWGVIRFSSETKIPGLPPFPSPSPCVERLREKGSPATTEQQHQLCAPDTQAQLKFLENQSSGVLNI